MEWVCIFKALATVEVWVSILLLAGYFVGGGARHLSNQLVYHSCCKGNFTIKRIVSAPYSIKKTLHLYLIALMGTPLPASALKDL